MELVGIKKERKPWVKPAAAILAVIVTYREIVMGQWIYVPIGILILLACFFDKDHVLSEDGIDARRVLLGKVSHDIWKWEDITAISVDRRKAKPNAELHIAKGTMVRVVTLSPRNCQSALTLAKNMNPKIYIEDLQK